MSDHTMTDPSGASGEQPSEEEVRAYLGQLRATPVDQVVAEVLSGLLNAAQVKLGRRDARLLIDLSAAILDRGRGELPDALSQQVEQALTQLRLAQVEAEKEVAAAAQQGHDEPSDLDDESGPGDPPAAGHQQATGPGPSGQTGQQPASSPTDRLWIPGR